MADVQLENGYIKIANELAEAFGRLHLTGCQWQVLWVIIRRTYGWNKKEDWISGSQIAQDTGLNRMSVCEALKVLASREIIIHERKMTAIQKDYELWQNVTKSGNVTNFGNKQMSPKTVTMSPKTVTKVSQIRDTQKTKDIITKYSVAPTKNEGQDGMDLFNPLAVLCKYDLSVITTGQKNDLYHAVGRLMNGAHATPKDLDQFREFWQTKDWRGKQQQAPKPMQVLEEWGAFRSWQKGESQKPKARVWA